MFDTIVKIILTLAVAGILIAILPVSPFVSVIDSLEAIPYLSYVNWFIPVGRIITTLTAWAAAIGVYYAIAWILRQLEIV